MLNYTLNDLQSIVNRMALDNGLSNMPQVIFIPELKIRGQFSRSMNIIRINPKQNSDISIMLILAHELFHANDYQYDSKELRELRANLFMLQYA